MQAIQQRQSDLGRLVVAGIVGGIVGGLAFGVLMALMNFFPMIASLAGSDSPLVGFGIHMLISAFIGATFGVLFGPQSRTFQAALIWGLVYGIVWWVLGPLMIMPSMMGMGFQFGAAFSTSNLISLMGHLLYGAVTGLAFAWFVQRPT